VVLALTDDPVTGQPNIGKEMGHALLWAGGAVPISLMSLACLLMGASQFLGYLDARRVTRHLVGVLGVSVGLSLALGAFSGSAGGRLGNMVGGGLAELVSAPLAALVGLGAVCWAAWAAWLSPSRATSREMSQEIETPAVSLQAKADGVTSEESAALAFEGEADIPSEATESPYPEDVRVLGEIPEGAAALGAEETSNHGEETENAGGDGQDEVTPVWSEAAPGPESQGDALMLASEQGDEEPAGEDLVIGEESSALDSAPAAEYEDDLSEAEAGEDQEEGGNWGEEDSSQEGAEEYLVEEEEEAAELEEEYEEEAEVEHEEAAELEEEDDSEDDSEDGEENEEEAEVEYEEAAELEEEADSEDEEEAEVEYEDAAELEEEEAADAEVTGFEPVWESQGNLFGAEDAEDAEEEVILEPQAKPSEAHEAVLMKAADLFLDRDRVAVSLLQRQFKLDFEESCAILDELQEMGLIGPYLGGNRRDILLTRDEWFERVGGAP